MSPENPLERMPIEELKIEPTVTVAIESRYGGKVILREVKVRPREGSRFAVPAEGFSAQVAQLGGGIPGEIRYSITAVDRDGTEVDVCLAHSDMLAITRVIKGTLRVR